jgi:hypothetical protein
MNNKYICMLIGKLVVNKLSDDEAQQVVDYINDLEKLLDEGDLEDFFGTEGWRQRLGLDE